MILRNFYKLPIDLAADQHLAQAAEAEVRREIADISPTIKTETTATIIITTTITEDVEEVSLFATYNYL